MMPFSLAAILSLLSFIPMAMRLKALLAPTELQFSLTRLLQFQFISLFYSVILPSGLGVPLSMWYKVTRGRQGTGVFIIVLLIERAMLFLTLSLLSELLYLSFRQPPSQLMRLPLMSIFVMLSLVSVLFLSCFLSDKVANILERVLQYIQSKVKLTSVNALFNLQEYFKVYLTNKRLVLKAFVYHLFYEVLSLMTIYFVFVSLSIPLSLIKTLFVTVLFRLLSMLPISIGGLGVREAGFGLLLSLYGVGFTRGVTVGASLSLIWLIQISVGIVWSFFDAKERCHAIGEVQHGS